MKTKDFLYRLLFTRDDDLDLLQVLFIIIVLTTLVIIWKLIAPTTPPEVIIAGLDTLKWMLGLLVVTAVPKWLVPFMVKQKDPKPDDGSEVS